MIFGSKKKNKGAQWDSANSHDMLVPRLSKSNNLMTL